MRHLAHEKRRGTKDAFLDDSFGTTEEGRRSIGICRQVSIIAAIQTVQLKAIQVCRDTDKSGVPADGWCKQLAACGLITVVRHILNFSGGGRAKVEEALPARKCDFSMMRS